LNSRQPVDLRKEMAFSPQWVSQQRQFGVSSSQYPQLMISAILIAFVSENLSIWERENRSSSCFEAIMATQANSLTPLRDRGASGDWLT